MKSLRSKLFVWYAGSLIFLAVFFYAAVHMLALPHATHTFLIILFVMLLIGFFIIYKITSSLSYLSSEMKLITKDNLHKRVRHMHGEDEISELAQSFNSLLNRIDEAFTREGQFIGDVAHELKTPLSTLQSSIDITLGKPRTKEEYKQTLQTALEETKRLSSTVNDVLDLAWTESPIEKKKASKVNLSNLMEELFEISQKIASHKKLMITNDIEKNIFIYGFREKLARAILNIIDNAIKYTDSGSIGISLKNENENAVIVISDTGAGIADKDMPHIFDRFYRGSKTGNIHGSGLGLAIAKSIITLHKGTISVTKNSAKGTSFIISLPKV